MTTHSMTFAALALTAGALGLAGCGSDANEGPLAVIETHERLGYDWPRTLVTYEVGSQRAEGNGRQRASSPIADRRSPITLSSPATPGNLRLIDAATGDEVPFQLWDVTLGRKPFLRPAPIASARISFFAELTAGGSYRYELHSGKPDIPIADRRSPITAAPDGNGLTLDNGIVAIRLPAVGERSFDPPLAFESDVVETLNRPGDERDHATIPGPVQGIRLIDGTWTAGSHFLATQAETAPHVTRLECHVTERGPLFVEARVRYAFDNGGWYELTARLSADDPAVHIDEQMDLGATGDAWALQVVFALGGNQAVDGWRPDRVFWNTNEGRLSGTDDAFEAAVTRLGFAAGRGRERNYGSRALTFEAASSKVFDVAVWYPWHPVAYYFGLVNSADLDADADPAHIPFASVVPMHAGAWRGATATHNGMLFTHQPGHVAIHWPLIAPPHPNTLLHTGEYDPDQPLSLVRRLWAWMAGPMQYHDTLEGFRSYDGYINLDAYKDWVLDWPADPDITYPRLAVDRQVIDALRDRLDEHPAGDTLRDRLFFNDSAEKRNALVTRLTRDDQWNSPLGVARHGLRGSWRSGFHWATRTGWAVAADELLSSSDLDLEQLTEVRAYIAAACYVMSNPDFNPRGSMVHLGNPNMPINRFMGLPFAAAVIPDHPCADDWLRVSADYVRFKLAMNTAPGGAWSEVISYYYASAPMLVNGALAAHRAGLLDEHTRELAAQVVEFTLRLLTPHDPRFGGRIVPGFGHEGILGNTGHNDGGAHMLSAAALLRDTARDRAAALAWAWDQMGRPAGNPFDTGFGQGAMAHADLVAEATPDVVRRALQSTWLPGFGAVLRAHAGEPDETYLAYRQGYMVSHSDDNQGDFVLYAKGAPLTTMSLHAYPIHQHPEYIELHKEFGWHSRVRFGAQSNSGGWPGGGIASQVHEHSFGDSVDYLRGIGDYGPQRWTRQILFLKGRRADGPNYFVFRDSAHALDGDPGQLEQKWWYQRTLGTVEQVQPDDAGFDYASAFGPRMQVRFLQPQHVQLESRQVSRPGTIRGTDAEDVLTVNAIGPIEPGQDILVAIVPYAQNQETPRYAALADGVTRITTDESTDYVFAHRAPITFAEDDIAFSGLAGAVRIYPDEVHLILAEGPGDVSYQGVTLRADRPATRIISTDSLTPRIIHVADEAHDIAFEFNDATVSRQVQPGVTRHTFEDGFGYSFDLDEPVAFEDDGIHFTGRSGSLVVDRAAGTTRMVVVDGDTMQYGDLRAWGAHGPYEVIFEGDRITGRTHGRGRFLYVTKPAALDRLPVYVLGGRTYAPGTSGNTLILPIMPGSQTFEVRAIAQPPVWRHPRLW